MVVRAAFLLSLVVILSSVPFSIDLDILDFFPNCSYTVFALHSKETLDMPMTKSSLAVSQDYLDFYYLFSTITFLGLGLGSKYKMGQSHKLLNPTIALQNPAVRPLGRKGGFW